MADSKQTLILSTLALFEANYGVKLDTMYRAFMVRKLQALPENVITDVFDTVISNYSRAAQDDRYKLYSAYPDWAIIKAEIDKVYHVPTESEKQAISVEKAWNNLLQAVETYGSYQMPEGLDETTRYCIRSLGGWSAICNWRESELNWRKKEFAELYQVADGRTDGTMISIGSAEELGGKGEPTPIGDIIGGMFKRQTKAIQ